MKTFKKFRLFGTVAVLGALGATLPASAHHSFASYNMEVIKVFTGVVTRVNPDANHLQIFFAPMTDERKNVLRDAAGQPELWAVEMTGSAQAAEEGITVDAFPPGTVFSVALHPSRSGDKAGARAAESSIFKCPPRTPPSAGKHCDSVAGNVAFGKGPLPEPKG